MCYLVNDLNIQIEIKKHFHNFNYKITNSVSTSSLGRMTWKNTVRIIKGEGLTGLTWRASDNRDSSSAHNYTAEYVYKGTLTEAWSLELNILQDELYLNVSTNQGADLTDRLLKDLIIYVRARGPWSDSAPSDDQQVNNTQKHGLKAELRAVNDWSS